jgi:hypothetical protein
MEVGRNLASKDVVVQVDIYERLDLPKLFWYRTNKQLVEHMDESKDAQR